MAIVVGWLLLAAGALAGWAARFVLIEPEHWQDLCSVAVPPLTCALRDAVVVITFPPRFSFAAAAALLAWVLRGRAAAACAGVALLAGGLGLFLYDTGWVASAVLAALLRLPRIGEEPPDPREFTA
ncbi:MAG: hypothetical protein IT486_08380 [Gammaproteobacteria bacterium]|nr:hypothetical protein [Gammaproteobacteria bacterium]